MAEEQEKDGEGEADAGSGKKKIILLVVLAIVLIGASVGGTLAVLSMTGDKEEMAAEGEGGEEEVEEVMAPAIYYALKPPIIVSFDSRGRQRLMQAEITLLTRSEAVVANIETHMPMIRNALVMLIGGQLFEEIQTAEGKELLRVQCLQELQRLMEKETGEPGIEQVLFTNLVMQ
ncbi:flagellar basal body-associated FliL family protein [Agarilytica rhodophyticola]|uniref:flagellar basal body-associated FliL family protein n=1 Tax=Agarilytica rhodophyticola TaxID=1737490 RepID=UPI000B345B6A|nr:flagellar basal body-associated FliL family protein [Agarilytica rhodophyticola]